MYFILKMKKYVIENWYVIFYLKYWFNLRFGLKNFFIINLMFVELVMFFLLLKKLVCLFNLL